ncbi:IclR family transcriptional regulator [Haematobacter missouriensis]|uniref:IclR family transcriptional regulator n=1 Tax=Haematobacter missouriensis TaxID=366616 RepID=A0A225CZY5_9RHOB|nr:helix-turn-helix domain-containing protein [Haematobacter missouriensis]OWJ77373.1 IclR family transcriptional regulator [Haematobacter missouriensis]OWJ83232.1 IclR family transcriptional regulator [Haematobacter missouriensis]
MAVKQAANVLDLLEYFAAHQRPASLAEISARFGWPRSSAFNIISTLVERGFLYEPKPRGGYYPTPRWLALAQDVAAAEPTPEGLQELLADLAAQTQETVWTAAQSGQQAILMSVIQSRQAIRYIAEPGRRVPLHGTASGQAIMCQLPRAQVTALLKRASYTRYGSGTPMTAEEVEESMATSLARGWFRSASAFSQDLGGVSVPLPLGGRAFSVTVAGPLFRIFDRMGEIALTMHRAIERRFGPGYFADNVPQLHRLLDEAGMDLREGEKS